MLHSLLFLFTLSLLPLIEKTINSYTKCINYSRFFNWSVEFEESSQKAEKVPAPIALTSGVQNGSVSPKSVSYRIENNIFSR